MIRHSDFDDTAAGQKKLLRLIKKHLILFGGNNSLKIYGLLQCNSGKRMLRNNRIFFQSEEEAVKNGFRPCGHCMKKQYNLWKQGIKK